MTNLTGAWSGIFNYQTDLPATAFAALLRDDGGALTGEVDEPDIFSADHRPIGALLDGRREGGSVRFVKYYDEPADGYDIVHYTGEIAENGDEITGRWDIPGVWGGTFIMTRESAVPIDAAADTGITVDR